MKRLYQTTEATLRSGQSKGMLYFVSVRSILALCLAVGLLFAQICSLGSVCQQNSSFIVLVRAFERHFQEYACLLTANFLTISGLWDIFEGIASVIGEIGMRAAHKDIPDTSDLVDQENREFWSQAWEVAASPRPLLENIHDKVVEPALVLVLTIALRFAFGSEEVASSIQLARFSMLLHLTKWLCETITICYVEADSWFNPQGRLFIAVMVLFALLATFELWNSITFNPGAGLPAAKWFNNARTSENQAIRRVHIQHLPAEIPQRVRASIHEVTHRVVTKWVEPTHRG
jgi:hypothetical protein